MKLKGARVAQKQSSLPPEREKRKLAFCVTSVRIRGRSCSRSLTPWATMDQLEQWAMKLSVHSWCSIQWLQLVSSVYSRVERIWLNQSRHPMNRENRYKSDTRTSWSHVVLRSRSLRAANWGSLCSVALEDVLCLGSGLQVRARAFLDKAWEHNQRCCLALWMGSKVSGSISLRPLRSASSELPTAPPSFSSIYMKKAYCASPRSSRRPRKCIGDVCKEKLQEFQESRWLGVGALLCEEFYERLLSPLALKGHLLATLAEI
jgi:hypothetical protein